MQNFGTILIAHEMRAEDSSSYSAPIICIAGMIHIVSFNRVLRDESISR
jgi:hypothetical protein